MREADRWLEFAKQDIRIAELALEEGFRNQVCFHSEQCVEKVLKAWLAEKGERLPRTRSMADLLTLIPADVIGDMSEEILLLDRFYISTRYPDALPGSLEDGMPDRDEAMEALDIASLKCGQVKNLPALFYHGIIHLCTVTPHWSRWIIS